MARATKKKAKASKKSARVTARTKTAAKAAKTAKKKTVAKKKSASRRIDPLNRKEYRSVTPMLAVADIRRAVDFYTAAFGFKVKSLMDSPHGLMHAELTLRDTTLMLGPESREQNSLSAGTIGNTPVTLYVLVEDVDGVYGKAVAVGGTVLMPVTDMFWGDRCGLVADPDGNKWMIATHKSAPTEAEMAEYLRQMLEQPYHSASAGAGN
jgi:PhnB protein